MYTQLSVYWERYIVVRARDPALSAASRSIVACTSIVQHAPVKCTVLWQWGVFHRGSLTDTSDLGIQKAYSSLPPHLLGIAKIFTIATLASNVGSAKITVATSGGSCGWSQEVIVVVGGREAGPSVKYGQISQFCHCVWCTRPKMTPAGLIMDGMVVL